MFFSFLYLFGILNGSTFGISISQENQFLLLSRPKTSDTFTIEFNDSEGDKAFVEHDNLVLVRTIINDMSESQEAIQRSKNSSVLGMYIYGLSLSYGY